MRYSGVLGFNHGLSKAARNQRDGTFTWTDSLQAYLLEGLHADARRRESSPFKPRRED
jgi:hypothetical protein